MGHYFGSWGRNLYGHDCHIPKSSAMEKADAKIARLESRQPKTSGFKSRSPKLADHASLLTGNLAVKLVSAMT